MSKVIENRYEFVYLFDVENGNPNGDPDAGNMPRIDPETTNGLVTDVCLKRKIRNYVEIRHEGKAPYQIYIREKAVLNNLNSEAYKSLKLDTKKYNGEDVEKARQWMCKQYYDVRTFGAVMSTGVNCGQVRGPVQINFGKSINPIFGQEISITRMAVTTDAEAEKQKGGNRTMGRKHIVPYALYRTEGYISANFAEQTGFSEDDLTLLWDALINMFDHDHSAARGKMNARKLVVFKHDSKLGNAPAHTLFELVSVNRKLDETTPVRAFTDYEISVAENKVPKGVALMQML